MYSLISSCSLSICFLGLITKKKHRRGLKYKNKKGAHKDQLNQCVLIISGEQLLIGHGVL